MQKFQGQHLVDLGGVIAAAPEMSRHDGFKTAPFEIRPRKSARIQKHFPNISGESVAILDPEMVELLPSEEQAFETERREEMIDAGHPLGHPGVVGVVRLDETVAEAPIVKIHEPTAAAV